MTLVLRGGSLHNCYPFCGDIYREGEPDKIIEENVNLCYSEEEFNEAYDKGEWEYDSDDEEDENGRYSSYSIRGDNWYDWEKEKWEDWLKTFGTMWLNGSYDRYYRTFPLYIIRPDADRDLFVKAYNVQSRGHDEPIWETEGFQESDYELAEELGILEPRFDISMKDEIEFDNMVNIEEEFQNDGEEFIDDYEIIHDGGYRNCEVVLKGDIKQFVEVKIESIGDKFAIGSIEGKKEVFIPRGVIKRSSEKDHVSEDFIDRTKEIPYGNRKKKGGYKYDEDIATIDYGKKLVGEMCLMDIEYEGVESGSKNIWKASKIHPKEQFVKGEYWSDHGSIVFDVECILQNHMKKKEEAENLRKEYIKIQPMLNEFWEGVDHDYYAENGWKEDYEDLKVPNEWFPKIVCKNTNESTRTQIFQSIITTRWPKFLSCSCKDNVTCENCKIEGHPDYVSWQLLNSFDPVKGIVNKIMC